MKSRVVFRIALVRTHLQGRERAARRARLKLTAHLCFSVSDAVIRRKGDGRRLASVEWGKGGREERMMVVSGRDDGCRGPCATMGFGEFR